MEPTCFACAHAVYPHDSTFCWIYQEPILDERTAAEECSFYAPEKGSP